MVVDIEERNREHLARILADLSRPDAYPYPVDHVDIEETHISLVFLAGDYVFKVKKPVDFGFLNFTTLDRRHLFCEEEVRLNRRLTHGVYLGVVPITDTGLQLRVDGKGPVVEYAVKMRRLRQEQTFLRLLERNALPADALESLTLRLTQFYRQDAARGPDVDRWGTRDAIWTNIAENVAQTRPYVGSIIAPVQLEWIESVSRDVLDREAAAFDQRVANGWIREGHGDLHLAHIFFERPGPDGVQIVDCVEFNPRLRCGDVAVDIAFLAMDLDHHQQPYLAAQVVELLTEQLADPDLPWLVHFYSIYRAHVRAKVACFRSDDVAPELPEALAVRTEAERYIDLATSYVIEPARPMLLLVGGLSGTGKSALARRLARSLGTTLASSDIVRKQLAGRSPTSYAPVPYGAGIYTEQLTTQTYETLLNQAAQALLSGHSVVLDATFLDATWRERARDLAQNAGADVLLIECQCPEPVVQQRLQARPQEPGQVSEATWAIYQEQRRRYGSVMEHTAGLPHLVVTTDRPTAQVLDDVLRVLPLRRRL